MNLACNISEFDIENTFFLDIKKNIIIDGTFTKIIYSTSNVTFNGIYLIFPIIQLTDTRPTTNIPPSIIPVISGRETSLINRTMNDWRRGDSFIQNTQNVSKYNISSFSILNQHNINIIKELNRIENTIIEYAKDYFNINKINIYSLRNQLKQGSIKIYNNSHISDDNDISGIKFRHYENEFDCNNTIIKISGIWENEQNIGITYKFLNN